MTIDEAIELLSNNGLRPPGATWGDYLKAVQLGISALKAVKRSHNDSLPHQQEVKDD